MPVGQVSQRVHVRRLAVDVHSHDGPRARRELLGHPIRIEVPGGGIGIDQNGRGAQKAGGVGGADHREGRNDDLISLRHAGGGQRKVDRRRPAEHATAWPQPIASANAASNRVTNAPAEEIQFVSHAFGHVGQLVAVEQRLGDVERPAARRR